MAERDMRGLYGVGVVATVVVAALVARRGCQDPPPPVVPASPTAPSASAPPSATATATASAPVIADIPTYVIDGEATTVVLSGARAGKGRFRVPFEKVTGMLRLNGNAIPGSALEVTIASSSLESSDDDLETQLESNELLEAERYPETTFVSTRLEKQEGATTEASYQLSGNLSFHGVLKNVVVPATIATSDDSAQIEFEIELVRADFGLVTGPDEGISDKVVLEIHLELRRAKPTR